MKKQQRLIVLSADAMVTEDLEYLKTLPNYKKYLEGGAGVGRVSSIYPTVTYPAHTSISTGTYPHKHGIYSNLEDFSKDWKWFSDAVKVEDIFTAAKKKGLTTAAVFWPVTGNHPDIDYLIDEYWAQGKNDNPRSAFARSGSNDDVLKNVIDKYMPIHRERKHPFCDDFVIGCAAEIIRLYKPHLIMIHPGNIDGYRHSYGVFGPNISKGVAETDEFIGLLAEAAIEVGIWEETNIVLLSDHGQMNIDRIINLNVILAENGLIKLDENDNIISWDAYIRSSGMSAYVYLRDKNDAELGKSVYDFLLTLRNKEIYGISEVLTVEEADERYKLNGNFSFVLETDGYTSFGDKHIRPLIGNKNNNDYRSGHATHGYMPEKGPQPVFRAKGPAFKNGALVQESILVNHAPTFAKILGVELTEAEGIPMTELLNEEYQ